MGSEMCIRDRYKVDEIIMTGLVWAIGLCPLFLGFWAIAHSFYAATTGKCLGGYFLGGN